MPCALDADVKSAATISPWRRFCVIGTVSIEDLTVSQHVPSPDCLFRLLPWPSPRPAAAQDAADAIVRLSRLESQVRQLSGQIEQLQFENRQLKDQVRKFQEDVEFRFQESRGGSRPPAPPPRPRRRRPAAAAGAGPAAAPQRRLRSRRAPDAPGAPRPLGSTPPLRAPCRGGMPGRADAAARRRSSPGSAI